MPYKDKEKERECKRLSEAKRYARNRQAQLDYKRKERQLLRAQLFIILGGRRCSNPRCAVPGGMTDDRCLQFDHINGGGTLENRTLKGSVTVLKKYVNNPELAKATLQVLCANCNWIKRHENNEIKTMEPAVILYTENFDDSSQEDRG